MKVKTSELFGNALSYVVSSLEMPHLVWGVTIGLHHASDQIVVPELEEPHCYSPYSTWYMCGPIIEREKIFLCVDDDSGQWLANEHAPMDEANDGLGPTPLVAAMRCYVASRLGDDVEIPEGLQ